MTFDDDPLFLETPAGRARIECRSLGLEWPPPEQLVINGVQYCRDSVSSITDEQRETMTNVLRGALYKPHVN